MYLDVKIDNILPITEVKDSINQLIDKVAVSDEMYVVTKEGKPSAILVGVHHLEKLAGISHEELMPDTPTVNNEPSEEVPIEKSLSTKESNFNQEATLEEKNSTTTRQTNSSSLNIDDLFAAPEIPAQPEVNVAPTANISSTSVTDNSAIPTNNNSSSTTPSQEIKNASVNNDFLGSAPANNGVDSDLDDLFASTPEPTAQPAQSGQFTTPRINEDFQQNTNSNQNSATNNSGF